MSRIIIIKDKSITLDQDVEELQSEGKSIQDVRYLDFFNNHRFGNWIFDARISYSINEMHKIALISANVLNNVANLTA